MTDKELTIAVEWFVFHHGEQPTDLSVFETYAANCKTLGLSASATAEL